ncbi:AfsA-related hotdog domain-containing protein [Burkholderia plantarii]|uniref:AfsA-related hotdog domain-containing protein n=1 Tax=Burkholderia plantarii TaxID=41899 RepID=UPI0018DD35B0|nr:AfsA-related hotdog domain-containing protein [Burkholderia plantarii]MBI0325745.1 hypothetical protein [Burkholderia plantarii]
MTGTTVIAPKLLHKNSADDVLLTRPRMVLPSRFASAQAAGAAPGLAALERLYLADDTPNRVLRPHPGYALEAGVGFDDVARDAAVRGMPHQVLDGLAADGAAGLPDGGARDDAIERFLAHHGVRARSTSFEMVNLADHYFFYRKPHEHVPGIMLLEAARQTIYYQLYTYSKHALGKVTVSLSELNAKFHAYADLMYPIEIVVDDLTGTDDPAPREVRYSTSFYQRRALIARIDSLAPVIGLERFTTARNAYLLGEQQHFAPLPGAPVISLLGSPALGQQLVSLKKIGRRSCVTGAARLDEVDDARLTVIYDGSLCFHAPVARAADGNDDGLTWNFGQIEYAQLERLKEMIKRGFRLS